MLGYWEKPEPRPRRRCATGGSTRATSAGSAPDGYLQITGRTKELYKSGGELVMPKEVEELLTRHPGVSQAYVVGVPDDRWGEIGCAWVVLDDGASVRSRPTTLIVAVPGQAGPVQGAQAVVRFVAAAELPTTPTGKVQKFQLVTEPPTSWRGAS